MNVCFSSSHLQIYYFVLADCAQLAREGREGRINEGGSSGALEVRSSVYILPFTVIAISTI